MKTSDIVNASIVFAEFDSRVHHVAHDDLGLHKVRIGTKMYTRDEVLILLKAELLKLKESGL